VLVEELADEAICGSWLRLVSSVEESVFAMKSELTVEIGLARRVVAPRDARTGHDDLAAFIRGAGAAPSTP
jgi:hypothetical protein